MPEEVVSLVTIASFGNTPGAMVNWVLGRFFWADDGAAIVFGHD